MCTLRGPQGLTDSMGHPGQDGPARECALGLGASAWLEETLPEYWMIFSGDDERFNFLYVDLKRDKWFQQLF